MIPLVATGIASVANHLLDAWTSAAQRKVAVQEGKFQNALGKAMGTAAAFPQDPAAAQASALRAQVMEAPEVKSALGAQDPTRPAALQISADGRMWLQRPDGGFPSEVRLSPETQAAAARLAAMLPQAGGAAVGVTLR